MPKEVPCNLFALVESWTQSVSEQADHSLQQPPPSPPGSSPPSRSLRPRPIPNSRPSTNQRRHLAPTSANPRTRKAPFDEEERYHSVSRGKPRKRVEKIPGNKRTSGDQEDEDQAGMAGDPVKTDVGAKRCGRPVGSTKNKHPHVITAALSLAPSASPSRARSQSKSLSPKRAKSLANIRTDISIGMDYLRYCKPSVLQETIGEARQKQPIPSETQSLYQKLTGVPFGCTPAQFKVEYQQEEKEPVDARFFLPSDQHPFPTNHLQSLKRTVDRVVKKTLWNFRKAVHERQWGGTVVAPLIDELQRWPQLETSVLMNVEACAIEPLEILMERPDGELLDIETLQTPDTTNSRDTTSQPARTTSRMVDWSVGLDLEDDEEMVDTAFNRMHDHAQSLNQSLSYINKTPLFLDFELKKDIPNHDPKVQLAIWKSGLVRKMQSHQWDMSLPMPGITVSGSEWCCYLFFMRGPKLIMIGPLKMGSTLSVEGTFEIVYKLHVLMKWGMTEYRAWFNKHILSWCQHKGAGTIPLDAALTALCV